MTESFKGREELERRVEWVLGQSGEWKITKAGKWLIFENCEVRQVLLGYISAVWVGTNS